MARPRRPRKPDLSFVEVTLVNALCSWIVNSPGTALLLVAIVVAIVVAIRHPDDHYRCDAMR